MAERSLREVVRRHEALRTVFRTVEGQLLQVVLPDVPCPLPIVDLSHLPPRGPRSRSRSPDGRRVPPTRSTWSVGRFSARGCCA